jgi:hypothetical protein
MPVQKGPGCVGREMELFSKGQLHSGKSGKVVTDSKQAKAIALSACGESSYAEVLSSLGFPEETASLVVELFADGFLKKAKTSVSSPSFEEVDWGKQFHTGKGPGPKKEENYKTGKREGISPTDARIAKTGVNGDNNRNKQNTESGMISPVAFPKGPGDPMAGSSKEVFGLRALG